MNSDAVDLLMNSWRPNTTKAYNTYIKKWHTFTVENSVVCPSHEDLANFLAELYKAGASYSTVNLARSTVSAFLSDNNSDYHSVGSHPVVCRVVKGVFENRPSLPKYQEAWDVDTVVEYLETWAEVEKLNLKHLTLRLVMLLALVSGQRGQTLHTLQVNDVKVMKDKCTFVYSSVLKQSKPGKHVQPLVVSSFVNKKLCIVEHVKEYLKRTQSLREGRELFIAYVKPHKHISRDTISRWIKIVLELSGIDITKFAAHSTRTAVASAAFSRDVPLESIMNAAGWARKSTFSKFYCKPVVSQKSVSQSVLDNFVTKVEYILNQYC